VKSGLPHAAVLAVLVAGCVATTPDFAPRSSAPLANPSDATPRARGLGVPFDGRPGPWNAITDVPGVLVGQSTLIRGDGAGAVRTGITAILPRAELGYYPAATFVLNGDGELSGAAFAEDFGVLRAPILLTGTWSTGTAYSGVLKWCARRFPDFPVQLPVIADTYDGEVSVHEAFPLTEDDVFAALDAAATGPVAEGNVGGGTGMICHEFKGGIGTSSRVAETSAGPFTVGVLVQANHGLRETLTIAGVPVGAALADDLPLFEREPVPANRAAEEGSILIVIATDAPVSALTLRSMAKRAPLGLARAGGMANPTSGDFVLAFSTQRVEPDESGLVHAPTLSPYAAGPLYAAVVQATEEAIVNALVAARTLTGRSGTVHALPHGRLVELLRTHGRWAGFPASSAGTPLR